MNLEQVIRRAQEKAQLQLPGPEHRTYWQRLADWLDRYDDALMTVGGLALVVCGCLALLSMAAMFLMVGASR